MNRILWNHRPEDDLDGGDIDEVVFTQPRMVHVEQLDATHWILTVVVDDEQEWTASLRRSGRAVVFCEESSTVRWDRDDCHDQPVKASTKPPQNPTG